MSMSGVRSFSGMNGILSFINDSIEQSLPVDYEKLPISLVIKCSDADRHGECNEGD